MPCKICDPSALQPQIDNLVQELNKMAFWPYSVVERNKLCAQKDTGGAPARCPSGDTEAPESLQALIACHQSEISTFLPTDSTDIAAPIGAQKMAERGGRLIQERRKDFTSDSTDVRWSARVLEPPAHLFLLDVNVTTMRPRLQSFQEHVLRRIVFGRRPGYTPHAGLGNTWKTDIRVLGPSVAASGYCDDEFVVRLYKPIPHFIDHSGYYLVHEDLQAKPEVDLDLVVIHFGWKISMIQIPKDAIPLEMARTTGEARSNQSRLLAVKVALFNMELNLKFPPKGDHTVSWRWKSARVVAPQDSDWGI
ncbi:hypothetical protein B0H14DRAFT_2620890 [Mycena olivaceomarginata]|nr:hypothetical protein B0H14DRAFT_2620890 [Mycena olivaceomarginata]